MLRGNRLLISTFGTVAAIAVGIGVWTWPAPPKLASYGEINPRNEQYAAGGSDCDPTRLAAIRGDRRRESKADACAKGAEEYRQNTADLIQQTRAANAAEAQANIASQQLWTGWLQTIGGFLTLFAAGIAAWYAREAAEAAGIAHKSFQDAARPVVIVSLDNSSPGLLWLDYEIVCANVGGSGCVIEMIAQLWREKAEPSSVLLGDASFKPIPPTGSPVTLRSDTVSFDMLKRGMVLEGVIHVNGPFIAKTDKVQRFAFEVFEEPTGDNKAFFRRVKPINTMG